MRRPLRYILGLGAAVCLGACVLTTLLGRMTVGIGVDIDAWPGNAVSVTWPSGSVPMEEIDPVFAPHHFEARILAGEAGDPHGQPGGLQVVTMAGVESAKFTPEEDWATISTYFLLHGPTRPAELVVSGWNLGPNPYFSFETDRSSENVVVQSGHREPTSVELFSETRGRRLEPIATDGHRRRFYVRVPRKALVDLRFEFSDQGPATFHRVYVNAFVPAVYNGDVDSSSLPPRFYLGANTLSTWFVCVGISSFVLLALLLLVKGARFLFFATESVRRMPPVGTPLTWKVFGVFWLPVFLVWFIFLLSFYPGTMNVDSLSQWEQAQTYSFDPQHPPFYAWLMWLMRQLWDSPFSVTLPQVLIGSALVSLSASLLWCSGVSRVVVILAYLIAVFSPRNMTLMIALIKDAPYGMALYAVALFLSWILLRRDTANWKLWAALGFSLAAATLFRHNGPLVVVGLIPFIVFFFYRQWRGVVVCMAVFLIVFLGARLTVLSRLPMEPTSGGLHDMFTAHLAILIDRDVPLANEDYTFLAKVRDLNDRWAYDKRRVAATTMPFIEEAYHRDWAKEHQQEYRGHYVRLVMDNPWVASRYFWDRGEFLVVPWSTETPMETYFLGISSNALGLYGFQVFLDLPEKLSDVIAWTASDHMRWLFWRPAVPLYGILLACLVLGLRTRDPRWCVVYLPFLLNTGVIGIAAISQASRYQFPLTVAAAFLIALAFLPVKEGEDPGRTGTDGSADTYG